MAVIHVVCLDAPSPPDYGGAIDMYYKIEGLSEAGFRVRLHFFYYRSDRGAGNLSAICDKVYAYSRRSLLTSGPLSRPYIVASRINHRLIRRLNSDRHPVLLEGLHCAGILKHLRPEKKVVLRMHNDEPAYYHQLSTMEKNRWKRLYFREEAKRLEKFQQQLPKELTLACLSTTDKESFEEKYGFTNTHLIPCFVPWKQALSAVPKKPFCLYHGNMAINENEEAAAWLITQVFEGLQVRLVVAGKNISGRLQQLGSENKYIEFVNNPTINQLDQLIREAQIQVLPSMNSTGVKLKLLHAAFEGGWCLTNNAGAAGSAIESALLIEEGAAKWKLRIQEVMEREFSGVDAGKRRTALSMYDNPVNVQKLSELW